MINRFHCLTHFLALIAFSINAIAQISELEIRGTVGFSEYGEDLLFSLEEIANTNSTSASGTLRLVLQLRDVPYTGGLLGGIEFATIEIDPIEAGKNLNGIEEFARVRGHPKKGSYYPVFILYEKKRYAREQMVDWVAFENPISFAQTSFEGGASLFQLAYNQIRVNLDGVTSELPATSSSRPLRISLRGYETPNPSVFDFPTIITVIDLPTISPGTTVTEISLERLLIRPKDGTYYLVLILSEFAYGRWVDADQIAFSEPWVLTSPTTEISIHHISQGTMRLDWNVKIGYRYTPQSSSNFVTWVDLQDPASVRSSATSTLSTTLEKPKPNESRFYRVIVEPLLF